MCLLQFGALILMFFGVLEQFDVFSQQFDMFLKHNVCFYDYLILENQEVENKRAFPIVTKQLFIRTLSNRESSSCKHEHFLL
jgi:hypothetical protein